MMEGAALARQVILNGMNRGNEGKMKKSVRKDNTLLLCVIPFIKKLYEGEKAESRAESCPVERPKARAGEVRLYNSQKYFMAIR